MVDIPFDTIAGIPPAEVAEVELYHPKSWWTRYVFSQDAKVIIEEESEYHAWLEKQQTFADLSGRRAVMRATYKSGGE